MPSRARAQHRCQPPRQATAASTLPAATMCWLTKEPSTDASHKGKQQLQAPSQHLPCAGPLKSPAPMQATQASNGCKHLASCYHVPAHPRARHRCKPHGQAITASTQQAADMCWLTHEPSTDASHKGKQQPQTPSQQLPCAGSHKSPAPRQATQASNSCKHLASSYHVLAHERAQHRRKPHR